MDKDRKILKLDDVIKRACEICSDRSPYKVAVAVAQDPNVLSAVAEAQKEGIAKGLLFGNRKKIEEISKNDSIPIGELEIIDIQDDLEAATCAVSAVNEGKAHILMKGFVKTGDLLKMVLSREFQLRGDGLLSHVAVMEVPSYNKLFAVTDGGMVVHPSLEDKISIIRNAGKVLMAMGVRHPRVAALSMVDVVYPGLGTSLENATIGKMGDRNQFAPMIVDGPVTFDVAFSEFAARYHNIKSRVAGKSDVLIVNSIEEGNILIKSLAIFARARFAGVIVGAKIPISLVSRTDTIYNKKASIALAVLLSHYLKRQRKSEI